MEVDNMYVYWGAFGGAIFAERAAPDKTLFSFLIQTNFWKISITAQPKT